MNKKLTNNLAVLVALTMLSIILFNTQLPITVKKISILIISFFKIVLVSLYFMNLIKAHTAWRVALFTLTGIIMLIISLL